MFDVRPGLARRMVPDQTDCRAENGQRGSILSGSRWQGTLLLRLPTSRVPEGSRNSALHERQDDTPPLEAEAEDVVWAGSSRLHSA